MEIAPKRDARIKLTFHIKNLLVFMAANIADGVNQSGETIGKAAKGGARGGDQQ